MIETIYSFSHWIHSPFITWKKQTSIQISITMPDLLFFVELFFNNSNSILFSIVLFYILIHDVLPSNEKKQKVRKLNPPGPIGLPILGYLPFLSKFAHEDFVKLSAKYGPVFSLKLGRQNVVV